MNPFRTHAILETARWPARPRAVAFVQVADVVEMLIRKKAQFATCEFCQSVNHLSDTRCRTCGGALPPNAEAEAETATPEPADSEAGSSSDARSLRNVMQMALLPPLLLFTAFAAWTAWRTPPARQPSALIAAQQSSRAPLAQPVPRVATRARVVPAELGLGPSEVLLSSTRAAASPAEKEEHAKTFAPARAPAEGPPAPKQRKAAQAVTRLELNPLAACSNSNFFARAICINNRCADPKLAQSGQCREAIRQRRIDEARRNPSLMG